MAWDRIFGHDAVLDRFRSAFARGRLGQAYLFVGPAGVGKKLFARELGKALLCERPPAPLTACGRCASCSLINADTHPDLAIVRRPEDKQEFPVDLMHEVIGGIGLKASRGGRKVVLIDDADDLNAESANAFLKTLEEPPPGSLLILLATAAEAQLSTILSRCQLVRFRPLPADDVRRVLAANGVEEFDKADRIVNLARGSPGQALALADDEVWDVRRAILDAVTGTRPNPGAAAAAWSRFVDDAGKDAAAQRRRASQVVRLLIEISTAAVRATVGVAFDADPTDANRIHTLANRRGADGAETLLECCLEADYHIDRRVQLALVIDALTDAFAKGSA